MAENINCVPTDYKIYENFEDTIQAIKFYPNPQMNILASGGWDNKIRIWDIKYEVEKDNNFNNNNNYNLYYNSNNNDAVKCQFNVQMLGEQTTPDPILNLCWKGQSTTNLFFSDTEGKIFNYDVQSNAVTNVGAHHKGCKEIQMLEANNMSLLVSGGWDGVLNFWDFRQQTPVFNLNLNSKIFSMSLTYPLLLVALDNVKVCYFNLNKLGYNFNKEAEFNSHLKYQTRTVSTFPDAKGYAIGGIEGRVALKNIDLSKQPNIDKKNMVMSEVGDFAHRTHRLGKNNCDIYPVNCITFNKTYGTFATGGGDGRFFIWDKTNRAKLKTGYFDDNASITAIDYNGNGDLFAYAAGYDWSKGIYGINNIIKPRIGIHYLLDSEKKEQTKNNIKNKIN